jgi:hypothetical protein
VAPVNTVSASTAAENVPKRRLSDKGMRLRLMNTFTEKRVKLFADSFRAALSQLHEKIIRQWHNANKKIIFIAAPVIAIIVIATFFFIPMGKDKSSFMKKSTEASRANTESEQKVSEQAEMKPNVGSLKAEEIDFIYAGIRLTGGDVTLSIRIRNNSKIEKSVALYDTSEKSYAKSKLIDKTGKNYEVTEVNFVKGSQKITSKAAGTKGVAIKPHGTIRASLLFKKASKGINLIYIHPFIYKSRYTWTEHDLPLIFGITQ